MEHLALFRLAADQEGLFTWGQARDAGYSAESIRTRLQDGRWRQVLGRRVMTADHRTDSLRALDVAAHLAGGPESALSGPSAARWLGLFDGVAEPCITLPRNRHLTLDGVTQLRGRLLAGDVTEIDGVPVTAPRRTLVDCIRLLPFDEAISLAWRALQLNLVDVDYLGGAADGRDWRIGVDQLRRIAIEVRRGDRSHAERLACDLLVKAGVDGWVPNHPVFAGGRLVAVVDLAFPDRKLAVELDGYAYHSGRFEFQHDRTRQNELVALGWTVLRFTWDDLTDRPREVVAAIVHAVKLQG